MERFEKISGVVAFVTVFATVAFIFIAIGWLATSALSIPFPILKIIVVLSFLLVVVGVAVVKLIDRLPDWW